MAASAPSRSPGTSPPSGAYLRGRPAREFPSHVRSILWLGGLVVVIVLAGVLFGDRSVGAYLHLLDERRAMEAEVDALRTQHDALAADLEALAKDPAALERVAREIHGMHAPGERVLQVVEEAPKADVSR